MAGEQELHAYHPRFMVQICNGIRVLSRVTSYNGGMLLTLLHNGPFVQNLDHTSLSAATRCGTEPWSTGTLPPNCAAVHDCLEDQTLVPMAGLEDKREWAALPITAHA